MARATRFLAVGAALVGATLCFAPRAAAQLRIVTYNTATAQNPGTQTVRPSTATVFQAIGEELVGGIARPIDVLLLQEQFTMQVSAQSIVDMLNGIYGAGAYARSELNGQTSDGLARGGRPGLVYNTQTVQLVGETFFGNVGTSTSQQPRSTLRYALKPVGYDDSAIFYAYNSHYKSDTGSDENMRRMVEAQSIRANSDALGEGVHALYVGDYNIQSSNAESYQALLAAGNGQAFDPIGAPGTWHQDGNNNNTSFKIVHTQSPASVSQFSGQSLGGMDDRFDFQLITGELQDGEGMSYITGSYHAFGNNGTHICCNSPITTGTGASPAVLTALMQSSDHLPVVADYQLPARMGVELASIPTYVELGSIASIALTVMNTAPTALAIGADELDYSITSSGDVSGSAAAATDAAGGSVNVHPMLLATDSLGLKSGSIQVAATSPQASNPLVTMPVSFTVIESFLAADFNKDGAVDAIDLAAWNGNFGLASGATKDQGDADGNGAVDGGDFLVWQQQLGQLPLGVSLAGAVPEPMAIHLLAVFASAGGALRRGRAPLPRRG